MELSRGYDPIFQTTVKGLKKNQLPPISSYTHEQIHELIAANGVKPNSAFPDFKMLVYEDGIKFEKASDGTKFPDIPFGSVHQLIVLPNFPDVCYLSFRRRSGEVYVILRMRKVEHVSKLANIITTWNNTTRADKPQRKPKSRVPSKPKVLIPAQVQSRKGPEPQKRRKRRSKSHNRNDQYRQNERQFISVKQQVPNERVVISRTRNVSQPPRYVPDYPRRRYGSSTGSWDFENEKIVEPLRPIRNNYEGFRIIVPRQRYNPRQRKPWLARDRVIDYDSDSSSSTVTITTSDSTLFDARGRRVKTIYPSFMDGGRMSPRTLHNENLLQMLHRPLNAY